MSIRIYSFIRLFICLYSYVAIKSPLNIIERKEREGERKKRQSIVLVCLLPQCVVVATATPCCRRYQRRRQLLRTVQSCEKHENEEAKEFAKHVYCTYITLCRWVCVVCCVRVCMCVCVYMSVLHLYNICRWVCVGVYVRAIYIECIYL